MHAPTLLYYWLGRFLSGIHANRLRALFDVVAGCVGGTGLSVTPGGRPLSGLSTVQHQINRADRLLGNRHLYAQRHTLYQARGRVSRIRIAAPLLLSDWSDLKADQSRHLRRAARPVGGRGLTL